MNNWSDLCGCHFRNFGFRQGVQASLHFMRFSSSPVGLKKFVRSRTIIFRNVSYDQAVIEDVERTAAAEHWSYKIRFTHGDIIVEADDMVSISWNIV
jgi:hypothetical protein